MCCAARRESVKNEIYLSNFCNYPTAFLSCAAFHQRIEKHKQFNNDRWFLLPIVVTSKATQTKMKNLILTALAFLALAANTTLSTCNQPTHRDFIMLPNSSDEC